MNASSSNVRSSSTSASANSLRPRARRLISSLSEDELGAGTVSVLTSDRRASPIPSAHSWRTAAARGQGDRHQSLGSFWDSSWSTLQGLASDLIGNDITTPDNRKSQSRTNRTPANSLQSVRASTISGRPQWGPSAPKSFLSSTDIGAGTKDEQLAVFRAEKRRAMLMQHESSYADTLGKFKRRLSDERPSSSAPPTEPDERDALVYVHHVQRNDTLAGLTIKYNCNAATLRKANRMWPNDTVLNREVVLIPVDACGVKGKRVSESTVADLLGDEGEAFSAGQAEEVAPSEHAHANGLRSDIQGRSRAISTSTRTSSLAAETNWRHDSWVSLPGSPAPIQIGRIPRRAIGYFPPARRKSNAFSELDTPSASLELNRASVGEDTQGDALGFVPQLPGSRQTSQRPRTSNGRIPAYLTGPGGVGMLSKHVHVPGPAQDGLNKYFAKHLPDVAPPRYHQTLLAPEVPMYTDEVPARDSRPVTPVVNKPLNFSNVGGQIEAWARRMASVTQGALQSPGRQKPARASVGTPGRGVDGIGDLIEMTDEFAIEDDDGASEDAMSRGRVSAASGPAETDDYFAAHTSRARLDRASERSTKGKAD